MTKDKQETAPGRPYGGESSGERTLRRRQQFLEAGLELFGTVGYRATTVRTLCKQAQLTDRYFYESFAGTEDLLVEVYRNGLDGLRNKVWHAMSAVQPRTDVRAILAAGLNTFFAGVEDARVARVIWLEVLGVSPRVDQMYNAGIGSFATLFLALARDLYPRWSVSDEQGRILAIAVIGAVSQSAMAWLLSGYEASRETMVTATSQIFLGLATILDQ